MDSYKLIKNRKEVTSDHLDKYGFIFCQRCSRSSAFKFEVHHIVYRSEAPNHPELDNKENLIIVCDTCHKELHTTKKLRNPLILNRKLEQLFNRNLIIE